LAAAGVGRSASGTTKKKSEKKNKIKKKFKKK
jgi:hypothetical protein